MALGAALARTDIGVVLAGEGAECALYGLFVGDESQHLDNFTVIDHAIPHGTSRELYKGILDGRARGVFHGKIIVRPDAQKTDAIQTNKNLLLSAGARVHTRPQLEIRCNDVKCAHGATVGPIDGDALFYLCSRGLEEAEARRLLVRAFLTEALERAPGPRIRQHAENAIAERMGEL